MQDQSPPSFQVTSPERLTVLLDANRRTHSALMDTNRACRVPETAPHSRLKREA